MTIAEACFNCKRQCFNTENEWLYNICQVDGIAAAR